MDNALIVVDAEALRRWLHQDRGDQVCQQWRPTAEELADLVDVLDDELADHAGLACAAWRMTRATSIFTHLLHDGDVVFGADIAGGGRIISVPQDDNQLRDSGDRTGVEAAVEALLLVASLLNAAYPHEFV